MHVAVHPFKLECIAILCPFLCVCVCGGGGGGGELGLCVQLANQPSSSIAILHRYFLN